MRLLVFLSMMLMPFLVFGQFINVKPDSMPRKVTPQEVKTITGWRNMKPLRCFTGIFSISPLRNKTAGTFGAMEFSHELQRSKSLPFLYSLTFQAQLFSYEANHNYPEPYINLDGSITPNNEEYSLNGLNVSSMAELHYMAAYPIVFSLAAGPGFTNATLGRTREYRYYAGNGTTNGIEFHTSENDKSIGYLARVKTIYFLSELSAFSILIGTQRYRHQVSPDLQLGCSISIIF